VKGEDDSNKQVDCGTDGEEGVIVKKLLVGGLVDCGVDVEEDGVGKGLLVGVLVGFDVEEDEDWDKNIKGLVEKAGGFVDEVAGGWSCAKEVEGGLTGVFVVGG